MTNYKTRTNLRTMEGIVRSFTFRVKLEPDEKGWRAFYPPLEDMGASTWGKTKGEALKNIQEVLAMILEEFEEEGRQIPATKQMSVLERALVTINR